MHSVKILAVCSLFFSVAACSSGSGPTGFSDKIETPSESSAEVSSPVVARDVVEVIEAMKEDIAARETEPQAPLPPEAAKVLPTETEDLPEGTEPQVSPDQTASNVQNPEITASPESDDSEATTSPARAVGVLTPTDFVPIRVNGEQKYEANTQLSATAKPYTPPQEYESLDLSATYTPSQPQSDHRSLSKYDCLIGDCR